MGRRLFVVTALVGLAVIPISGAAPAVATDDITENAVGTYTYVYRDKPSAVWVLAPCDDDADRCVRVSQFSLSDTKRSKPAWSENAYWTVGSWLLRHNEAAIKCDDGSKRDALITYSWDAVGLNGFRDYTAPGICGEDAKSYAVPISLVRQESAGQ